KWIVIDEPREKNGIHLLCVELGHVVVAAVLAELRHGTLRELPGVRFWHDVSGERAGRVGNVDDAGLQSVADFKRRHRLWPTDVIDLDEAFSVRIDALDELFKTTRIGRLLGKRGDGTESHFFSERRRTNECCCEQPEHNFSEHADVPPAPSSDARCLSCISYIVMS